MAIARVPGDERSDRNTTKVETDRIQGDGHHARFPHLVAEAGLSCDDEDSEDGEEEGETAAAKETGEISKTHRIEEKYTQRRETTTERSEQKHQQCIRDKKRVQRQQIIQRILEDFEGVSNIPGIKSAKKTKIKNERGEVITSRKGIANVFGEFYKNFTTTRSKTNMVTKATLTCTLATLKK